MSVVKFEVSFDTENDRVEITPISGAQGPDLHFDIVVLLQYAMNRFFHIHDRERFGDQARRKRAKEIIEKNFFNRKLDIPYADPMCIAIKEETPS